MNNKIKMAWLKWGLFLDKVLAELVRFLDNFESFVLMVCEGRISWSSSQV